MNLVCDHQWSDIYFSYHRLVSKAKCRVHLGPKIGLIKFLWDFWLVVITENINHFVGHTIRRVINSDLNERLFYQN